MQRPSRAGLAQPMKVVSAPIRRWSRWSVCLHDRPPVKPSLIQIRNNQMTSADNAGGSLLTVKEAAYKLSLCNRTVRRLIKKGQLPYVRFGRNIRIATKDLERFIAAHRFD